MIIIMSCLVKECRNIKRLTNKNSGISFHRLPKDYDRRNKWMSALGIKVVIGVRFVCSQHFTAEDYVENLDIKVLKSSAVPRIFSNCLIPTTTNSQLSEKSTPTRSTNISFNQMGISHTSSPTSVEKTRTSTVDFLKLIKLDHNYCAIPNSTKKAQDVKLKNCRQSK